jgi:hypothetical protein
MAEFNDHETTDRVIEETRRIKEELAASFDYDIDRILEDARKRQDKSGRIVLAPPVRRES